MLEIFDVIREMTRPAILCRLLVAVLCGGAVGFERELKHRAAGFRTHILICMGAAVTTLTSQYLYLCAGYYTDVARLGAQVIAGIGFIGAGAIIVTKSSRIKGLTTAAGLWVSAIIGLACGAGYIECAVLATLIILAAEILLIRIEHLVTDSMRGTRYYLEYRQPEDLQKVLDTLKANGVKVDDLEISRTDDGEAPHFAVTLNLKISRKAAAAKAVEKTFAGGELLAAEEI